MAEWRILQPETPEHWEAYYALRYEVLRKPWGQGGPGDRATDDGASLHGMIIDENGGALAVGRIHRIDEQEAQIRFMAVRPDLQGKGVGKAMLLYIEKLGKNNFPGLRSIMLHARERAVPFYERNGYGIVEKSYLLFGVLPHYRMEKKLVKA